MILSTVNQIDGSTVIPISLVLAAIALAFKVGLMLQKFHSRIDELERRLNQLDRRDHTP